MNGFRAACGSEDASAALSRAVFGWPEITCEPLSREVSAETSQYQLPSFPRAPTTGRTKFSSKSTLARLSAPCTRPEARTVVPKGLNGFDAGTLASDRKGGVVTRWRLYSVARSSAN